MNLVSHICRNLYPFAESRAKARYSWHLGWHRTCEAGSFEPMQSRVSLP